MSVSVITIFVALFIFVVIIFTNNNKVNKSDIEELRALLYPRTDYVLGFVVGKIQPDESIEQAPTSKRKGAGRSCWKYLNHCGAHFFLEYTKQSNKW